MVNLVDVHNITKDTGPDFTNQVFSSGSSKGSQINEETVSNWKEQRKKRKTIKNDE